MTVLVAGVGNIFCTDDGFGPAVAARLLAEGGLGPEVEVVDSGIRGMHLAYRLLDGYAALVLVDVTRQGGEPGSLYLLEHDLDAADAADSGARFDPHGMEPDAVLGQILALARGVGAGRTVGRVLVLGCEPADLGPGLGLSAAVAAAVDEAVPAVRRVVAHLLDGTPFTEADRPNRSTEEVGR
jgi:hydrogenase maturation protease